MTATLNKKTINHIALTALTKIAGKESKGAKIPTGNHHVHGKFEIIGTLTKAEDTEAKPPLKLSFAHIMAATLSNMITNGEWNEEQVEAIFVDVKTAVLDNILFKDSETYNKRFTDQNGMFAEAFARVSVILQKAKEKHEEHAEPNSRSGAARFAGDIHPIPMTASNN